MSTTLTAQFLTRAAARVVMVPRRRRMSWQVSKNYSIVGEQEERS